MLTNEENELNAIQESLQRTYTTVTDEVYNTVTPENARPLFALS